MTARRLRADHADRKTVSVLAVPQQAGPITVKELIARAKAQPWQAQIIPGTVTGAADGHLSTRRRALTSSMSLQGYAAR